MKAKAIILLCALLLASPVVGATTYCNGNGGKGLCCIAEPVEGDPSGAYEACITNNRACELVKKKAPKSCNFLKGTHDYCYCKTLQACPEACNAARGAFEYAGRAVRDLYEHCAPLVKRVAGEDGYRDLHICYHGTKLRQKRLEKNCGEFVRDFCDRVKYEK